MGFGDMFGGFSGTKLKPQLKMAVSRFQIASNKKSALMKQNMREVAVLLSEEPPKEEKARIRAEALIRDDNLIEAYEILMLNCELLAERIKLLEHSKDCPADLQSCIATLLYSTPRVDIPELNLIRKQFRAKYGKKFDEAALQNEAGIVNERIVSKLSVHPPAAYLVHTYLERICEQFEVDWKPTIKLSGEQLIEPMVAPVGFSVPVAQGTGLGPEAVTGQPNIDEEISYQKPEPGVPPPLPPPAPAGRAVGPVVNATPYIPSVQSEDNDSKPATATVTSIEETYKNDNAYDEVDIYVPQISSPNANDEKKDDDDDDDRKPPAAGAGAPTSPDASQMTTYSELAARFESLGK